MRRSGASKRQLLLVSLFLKWPRKSTNQTFISRKIFDGDKVASLGGTSTYFPEVLASDLDWLRSVSNYQDVHFPSESRIGSGDIFPLLSLFADRPSITANACLILYCCAASASLVRDCRLSQNFHGAACFSQQPGRHATTRPNAPGLRSSQRGLCRCLGATGNVKLVAGKSEPRAFVLPKPRPGL